MTFYRKLLNPNVIQWGGLSDESAFPEAPLPREGNQIKHSMSRGEGKSTRGRGRE